MTMIRQFKVFFTVLVKRDVYGTTQDVSSAIDLEDFIFSNGVGKISTEVDNGDYDVGVFTYSDITLKAINFYGKFNDENDSRSIFPYTRDLTKVDIVYYDSDGNPFTIFKGVINEEATRASDDQNQVTFKVLSQDSVFRKTKVASGIIQSGQYISEAIRNIIQYPIITSVLTYNPAKINVTIDSLIDDQSVFDDVTVKEALDQLLVASNSVLEIDSSNEIVVRSREDNNNTPWMFYNYGSFKGEENIINLSDYNNGLQRSFNSVEINNVISFSTPHIDRWGLREKKIDIEFITDTDVLRQIAMNIREEFENPKPECEIEIAFESAKDIRILDLVRMDFQPKMDPYEPDTTLPLYDIVRYDEVLYPRETGNITIVDTMMWKVIGIFVDPAKLTARLKLRQRGKTVHEGFI